MLIKKQSVHLSDFMVQLLGKNQYVTTRVFIILIALLLLPSCLNKPYPSVKEPSAAAINRPKTHVVIPGETLFSIAWRYGLTYESLAKHNGIKAPYIIRPSQVIRLDMIKNTKLSGTSNVAKAATIGTKKPHSTSKNGSINRTTLVTGSTKKSIEWSEPKWGWPVKGPILSSFQGNNGLNKGIDLGGKLGEPVVSAAAGQVVYSGSGLRGYGKLLIIKHNENFLSAYAHNDKLLVKEGDFVKAGQKIADMGLSGTDRVKLHFEIRRDGTPVNPLQYLPRR